MSCRDSCSIAIEIGSDPVVAEINYSSISQRQISLFTRFLSTARRSFVFVLQ